MASCVRNICTKKYQNLVIGFQVTVKNIGDVFFGTQCSLLRCSLFDFVFTVTIQCVSVLRAKAATAFSTS